MNDNETANLPIVLVPGHWLGGWAWAWSPRRRASFDAAARLPLQEDTEEGDAP